MKLSFFRKRSWKKHLAVAVTAGILAGAYAPGAMADSGNYDNNGYAPEVQVVDDNISVIVHSKSYAAQGINVGYGSPDPGFDGSKRFVSTFNGNITMRDGNYDGGWGITSTNIHGGLADYKGARWQPAGIRAAQCGDVIINGDLDMAVYGSGLVSDPYYNSGGVGASITVNGNVNIETPTLATEAFYAIANYGGNITINESGTKDVVLKGNVITFKNDTGNREPFFTDAVTNITLNNEKSSWTGLVDNSGTNQVGETNLTVANGAQWYHETLSMTNGMQVQNMPSPSLYNYGIYNGVTYINKYSGGENKAQTGYIYAKDKAEINIADYSGYTTVFYEHLNSGVNASDYTAGDITIKKASAGSGITLVTANNNVKEDQINLVLNALAGKLTYADYGNNPDNLDATVKIANGLAADAVTVKAGNIVFASNGKGGYTNKVSEFKTTLTGDAEADTEYKVAGVLLEDGTYKFTEDSKIAVTGENARTISLNKGAIIDAIGKSLTLDIAESTKYAHGIFHDAAEAVHVKADTLNINIKSTSDGGDGAQGIRNLQGDVVVDADVNIDVNGTNNTIGIYSKNGNFDVNGNLNVKVEGNNGGFNHYGASGVYATSSMGSSKGGVLNVNSIYTFEGNANGIYANSGGSVVNVEGGSIKVAAGQSKGYAALIAEDATINMNVVNGEATKNKVEIEGNVVVSTGAINENDIHGTETAINLGLTTADSTMHGVVYNKFADEGVTKGDLTFTGAANLWLQNGATWTNEVVDTLTDQYGGIAYAGSHVTTLKGGASATAAGNIYQKDSKALTIDNYSGVTNVFYANDGAASGDFSAYGDTIIKHAESGSAINLITTAPKSVTADSITSVLNALAGKLTYVNYATANGGENNLTGTAKLAGGLTSDSVVVAFGDIVFDNNTGKGSGVSNVEATGPDHQITTEFANTLTGDVNGDLAYVLGGVRQADGTYKFTKDSKIVVDGAAAVQADKAINVDATGKVLDLKVTNGLFGIAHSVAQDASITADKLNVDVAGSDVKAISAQNTSSEGRATVTINADTDIVAHSTGKAFGIFANENADITINGNTNITIDAPNANTGWYLDSAAIRAYSANAYNPDAYSTININGDLSIKTDILALYANGAGSTINLNGGVDITTTKNGQPVILAEGGSVNINMSDKAEENVVKIVGNVVSSASLSNSPNKSAASDIKMQLLNKESAWQGVAYNSFPAGGIDNGGHYTGSIELALANGATWNNQLVGTMYKVWNDYKVDYEGSHVTTFKGGASAEAAGNIFQKDGNDLTIDNYSGVTNVFYANDGATSGDFSAYGDTIIKHAESGSAINLITTAPTSVTADSITSVLNALAGKLIYLNYATDNGGERNLTGTAKIAGGLTSNSAVMAFGDIVFNDVTGKGSLDFDKPIEVPEPPEKQEATNFNSGLNGDTNLEYVIGGVLQDDGSYKFTENTNITVNGGNAVSDNNNINVDASGKTLTLVASNSNDSVMGIAQANGNAIDIKADKLVVNVEASTGDRNAKGIASLQNTLEQKAVTNVDATTEITAKGAYGAIGVYAGGNAELNLHGNTTIEITGNVSDASYGYYSTSGLYAGAGYDPQTYATIAGATINANGNVSVKGDGAGIFANGGGSTINVNGGVNIEATSDYMPAVVAQSGTVNINTNADVNNVVNIKGNVVVGTGSVSSNEPCKQSIVNINLLNNASVLHGVAYNQFPEEGSTPGASTYSLRAVRAASNDAFTGAINVSLTNGAQWINEAQGKLPNAYTSGGGLAFTGSRVAQLTGGTGSSVGYIYQKDANKLTIDNLSGNVNITYDHTINEETQALEFKAGNTIIGTAAAGSKVTMATAANGINTADKAAVEEAFKSLAQKLTYNDAKDNPTNLAADMTIGGGLTGNTASWKGNIEFNGEIGGYQVGSAEQAINLLFDEDVVSKDTRAAIMSSMVTWRNAAADTYSYRHSARAPQGGGRGPVDSGTRLGAADEGVWARTWGGQNKYSGNNTSFKNSFWAGQVGYDKNLANGWNVGVAFDYMTSDDSYNSGSGDSKTYTLGFYGSKEVAKNEYVDVTAKIGRFSNDFETKDILGRTVKGDYKATGFSVSGKYSKRYGSEAAGYFEPSAQLTIGRMGSSDFDSTGTLQGHISQDAFTSIVGTLGLEAGQASEHGRYFARLSLNHEFAGSMDTHFSDAYNSKTREFDLDGTWCDLTMGGTYEINDNLTFYGDVTKTLNGDYKHDWMINAGLRFTF